MAVAREAAEIISQWPPMLKGIVEDLRGDFPDADDLAIVRAVLKSWHAAEAYRLDDEPGLVVFVATMARRELSPPASPEQSAPVDRDRDADVRDRKADIRDDIADDRDRTADHRDDVADIRDVQAKETIRAADARDLRAERRDRAAERRDEVAAVRVGDPTGAAARLDRGQSAVDRVHAGLDRDASASDRAAGFERAADSAAIREESGDDRFDSSVDRLAAEVDRDDARSDRAANRRTTRRTEDAGPG